MPDNSKRLEALRVLSADPFASWLGIKLEELRPGYCRASLELQPDMLNAAGVPHGGVIFSLADQAVAGASNAHGRVALGLSLTINFVATASVGMHLFAIAQEESLTERTGLYRATVTDDNGLLVAVCQATVYRTSEVISSKEGGA